MPSDQWKQDNPKISGHIPKSLKDQLDQFITEQKLSGVSEALRIILESHFNQSEFSTSSQPSDKSSQPVLNSIEERLKSVETQIQKHSDILEKFKVSQKKSGESTKSSQLSSELKTSKFSTSSEPFSTHYL